MTPQDIYADPDVFKPADGDLGQPVHTDVRGSIHRLEIAGHKLNLLFTREGFMRSGDLHKISQFDFVFSGSLELWLRKGTTDEKRIWGPNSFIEIPPHTPHLFNFLEDTLMAEWWDGPFEAWYYKPYRDIIDAQFQKMRAEEHF